MIDRDQESAGGAEGKREGERVSGGAGEKESGRKRKGAVVVGSWWGRHRKAFKNTMTLNLSGRRGSEAGASSITA